MTTLVQLVLSALVALSVAPSRGLAQSDGLRAEIERTRAARADALPPGSWTSIQYQLDVADRIQKDYPVRADTWRARARSWLELAKRGLDPLDSARGKIVMRGYDSPISKLRQGYAIYLPKNYDPKRAYPLMIALHGGSANGNLFLGVVLGNNMNWKEYDQHLWDDFEPKWAPDWIVVAPDGFGQVMWRFMGEQDVLDVIADVQKHHRVDDDRVVLAGLSNGGVGAYSLGMRHAWRFSAVLAIAGAPSWVHYAQLQDDSLQAEALERLSALSLAENAINTDFRFFHGHSDPGPMRPAYVAAFSREIARLGVPFREKWFDTGHDLLYLVTNRGKLWDELSAVVRKQRPSEVRVVTGDYRANRQHWLSVTGIARMPQLARVRARAERDAITIETERADALALQLDAAPLDATDALQISVDGLRVYDGSRRALGAIVGLRREGSAWRIEAAGAGAKPAADPEIAGFDKRAGSAGPITDAYYDAIAHVYGTGDPALTAKLKRAAERGARGWPLWLWRVEQRVLADTEVDEALMRTHHLVLYATPDTNGLLARISARLPIRVERDGVVLAGRRFGPDAGVRFIHPNPLAPERYVIVQAGTSADAVMAGHNLPDFLPDYVIYDPKVLRARPRLVFSLGQRPLAFGYFDGRWQFDPSHARLTPERSDGSGPRADRRPTAGQGDGPESAAHDVPRSKLGVPPSPPAPAPPTRFLADETTQAGRAARDIAQRVATFTNYRAKIPGATWSVDEQSVWSVRDEHSCLAALREAGVDAEPWSSRLPTPVPAPVRVRAEVAGVSFRFAHAGAGVVVSCELAARLADIAEVVKRHGVHTVYVMSAYRDHPYPSFHTLGLALDLSRFDTDAGPLHVKTDFVLDRNRETCDRSFAPPRGDKAQKLLDIACDLAATRRFSSVLTPNYNVGHRDHFHLDIRPDDPRLFVR